MRDTAESAEPAQPRYGTTESALGRRTTRPDTAAILAHLANAPPGERPAAPRRRLAARLIDLVCCGILVAAAHSAVWLVIIAGDPRLRGALDLSQPWGQRQLDALAGAVNSWAWLPPLVGMAVWFLYEVPMTALRGQTLGKMAVGIRVVTVDPTKLLGIARTAGRWSLLGLPGALGVYGLPVQVIDCSWLLRDPVRRQCLHDSLARTYVIASPRRR